ncbi:unnamed protein product [Gadus morhua 'NCC']
MSLQRNLGAVLSALAEESAVNRCPLAKGLYSFLATYRFVAAVYLQADVLPHLACLSKLFQKENVNFLALKHQGMDQQQIMTRLASQIDEWGQLYPGLNKLAAIGLTIPISSVNYPCEHRPYTLLARLPFLLVGIRCLSLCLLSPPSSLLSGSVLYGVLGDFTTLRMNSKMVLHSPGFLAR